MQTHIKSVRRKRAHTVSVYVYTSQYICVCLDWFMKRYIMCYVCSLCSSFISVSILECKSPRGRLKLENVKKELLFVNVGIKLTSGLRSSTNVWLQACDGIQMMKSSGLIMKVVPKRDTPSAISKTYFF